MSRRRIFFLAGGAVRLPPARRATQGDPSARWATRKDLSPLEVTRAGSGRLVVGRLDPGSDRALPTVFARQRSALLAVERSHSLLVIGPTQSCKTSGLAIPAVLEWEGPVLAASVKNDLVRDTLDWRRGRGNVWIYDPTAGSGFDSHRWCPLDSARTWSEARRLSSSLSEVARRSAGSMTDGDFWYSTASKLLAPILLAASCSDRTMDDVVRWVDEQEVGEVSEALEAACEWQALRAFRASWNRDDRQRSAVYTTAETVIEAFADEMVAEASLPGPGSIRAVDLLFGDNTLYLCAPVHHQKRLRPVFSTLVGQVIEAAYELSALRSAPLEPPLLVVIDEAANVAPLAELDTLASTAAGHGIQLVTVWQDLAQLSARYGERAGTVVNNHRGKLFLSGIADRGTLQLASDLAGETELSLRSSTYDAKGRSSTTEQPATRKLCNPDAMRRLAPGTGVLVSGHLPPARVRLRPWFEDAALQERAGARTAKANTGPPAGFGS